MAVSQKPTKFRQKLVPIPAPETPGPTEPAPEAPPSDPVPAAEAPGRKVGRPPKPRTADPTFWDAVQAIPREKWGPEGKAYIYLYIREPFCDIKTEGKPGYLMKCYEPIDADFIMRRYGSGRYYLMLKDRPNGQKMDTTVADLTFEIYNYEHPPKIPREFWHKDSRNERWVALLPKDQQQGTGVPPSGAVDPNKWFDTFMAMQDRVAERMNPQGESVTPTGQLSELVTAAAKLVEMARPATPAAPATDPFALLKQIMEIQTANPMVTTLTSQIAVMQQELSKERDNREASLRKELESMKEKLNGGNGESELDRLVKMGEKKEQIAKALGLATDAIEHVRSKPMPWWADILKETVSGLINSPLAAVIAQRMSAPPPGLGSVPPYPPPVNVQAQPAGQPNGAQPQAPNLMQFMEMVSPTMLRYFDAGRDGDEFADWMYAGYPVEFAQVQKLQHPLAPGQMGAPVLVALYKVSPYWPKIAAREAAFVKFAEDFCKWDPKSDDDEIPEAEIVNPEGQEPEHIDV